MAYIYLHRRMTRLIRFTFATVFVLAMFSAWFIVLVAAVKFVWGLV